ncbi:MAG: dihydrofolate reductase [Paludibacteraceae bacterium]|nr:dihydrofolate reductase [Paludibacteraceae bacterium]
MKKLIFTLMVALFMTACSTSQKEQNENFSYTVDAFADMQILRYRVPQVEALSVRQKELLYYLTEAALNGRDILYDQNGKYNLLVRRTLEAVYTNYDGDKNTADFCAFETYLKRVWVSNGIHHHYGNDKFVPEFSQAFFENEVNKLPVSSIEKIGVSRSEILATLIPVIFDPEVAARRLVQDSGVDLIQASACNYYEGVSQTEAEEFYNAMKSPADETPISYGLNSKLVKQDGVLVEKTYKIGGLYSAAIEKIVYWLEKAQSVAENEQQQFVISKLIEYYRTGDLKTFDDYSIAWVNDTASHIDFVNGFIETYGDPLGMKASWESLVNFKNTEATKRTEIISSNAQWFEDHSPVAKEFKKEQVKGVSAKVITAAILAGDCYPTTPIGINLPNANWIRAAHGSKSVTIENITSAYDMAAHGNGFAEEFAWSQAEIDLMNNYGFVTDNLHTDLHECLGHGSGKLLPGVDPDALKAYGSTIEEARADLFGLYFMADPMMIKLGLLPDKDAYKAEYYKYFMNGLLTQQVRIELGKNVEESHMRNRQLIARWVYEKAKDDHSVELRERNGKTFVVINDYEKIQQHLGELLAEIQRIKSTGDYQAAHDIVENYAVKLDPALHKQILNRYAGLNIAPYKGFVNPVYTPIYDKNGIFVDLKIDYTENYVEQHLRYSADYSSLPTFNK